MKIYLFILVLNLLFSANDSFSNKIDLKKLSFPKLNLNIIPLNNADSVLSKRYLEINQIEAIKIKAKNYKSLPVTDNDIIIWKQAEEQ